MRSLRSILLLSTLFAAGVVSAPVITPRIEQVAQALTYTAPGPSFTVAKGEMAWPGDGTRVVRVIYLDGNSVVQRRENFTIDAAGTKVTDRFGTTVATPSAPFMTALTTIESNMDNTLAALQAAGKLNPPAASQ
jgi:hypothetical protein